MSLGKTQARPVMNAFKPRSVVSTLFMSGASAYMHCSTSKLSSTCIGIPMNFMWLHCYVTAASKLQNGKGFRVSRFRVFSGFRAWGRGPCGGWVRAGGP